MTSACGVVESSTVDEGKDLKCAFAYGNIKAKGDIFEEYFYNMESMTITKTKPTGKTYTIGDEIPVKGASYSYPDSFDVIVIRDKVTVAVRDKKITAIKPLNSYEYTGVPVINGRGFELKIADKETAAQFLSELNTLKDGADSQFFNKWARFETYRNIVFQDL
jgi:sulfate adenylyltransferase subunit 1